MSKSRLLLLAAVATLASVHPSSAADSILVESRTLTTGQAACTVGVFISNSVPIVGLLFQLELRSVTGGAYFSGPVGSTFFRVRTGGRVDLSPLGTAGPGDPWPPAAPTSRRFANPAASNTCSGPVSRTWSTAVGSVDGVSPDAIEYATVSQGDPEFDPIALPAGSDPGVRDSASFFFLLDANGSPGCFEIDSCCTSPANHIGFIDENTTLIIPDFAKGTICIAGEPVNQPPVISCPANIQQFSDVGDTGAVVNYSVTVVDEDPLLSPVCNPASGSFFPIGTTLVTCIATDSAGLADTCTFNVSITVPVNQRPVVHCPPLVSQTVAMGESGGTVTFDVPVADDGPPLVAVCTPASGSFFSLGMTQVQCVAEDSFGLADTCSFFVYVSDLQASELRVESRTFTPGQIACSVGVFITNHLPIAGLVLQLELRSMSGGAFYKGPIASPFFRPQPGQRLSASPLGVANPPNWVAASTTSRRFDTANSNNTCSGPVSHTWGASVVAVGGTSPDAVEYATVSQGDPAAGNQIALAPGSDSPATSTASLVFAFDADTLIGCFEIDTACTTPANHLGFVTGDVQLIIPTFYKGTICISNCACDCHANPAVCSDPAINVLDVLYTINVAFRGYAEINDANPLCPKSATDVNCDGVSSVVDVIKMVDVAFRDGDPATVFCSPCP